MFVTIPSTASKVKPYFVLYNFTGVNVVTSDVSQLKISGVLKYKVKKSVIEYGILVSMMWMIIGRFHQQIIIHRC